MRVSLIIAAVVSAGFLSACDDKATCTPEDAQKKATELSTKITEMAATDPTKVAEIAPKIQELATKAAAGGDDLAAACKAMDEMMAELTK